jgi:outer membrane protein assembly factor BamB
LHWSDEENVGWKIRPTGAGWSSPVVVDNRVYLTGYKLTESDGLQLIAECFAADTGASLWKTTVIQSPQEGPGIHRKNSQASPTPIVSDDRLYVHFGHHGTACLNLNGQVLWKQTDVKYAPVHGNGGSPALVNDLLIFSCDGASDPFLVALDRDTGEVRWKTERRTHAKKTFSFSTPLVVEFGGQTQVLSPTSGFLGAYNPKDGKEIWRAGYGEGYSVITRPIRFKDLVYVGSSYDRSVVHAIRLGGKGDVTDTHTAWTQTRGGPNTPSMVVVGNELYFVADNGLATCADAATGEVHWYERLGGNYSASLFATDDRIYFQNEEGLGTVVRADKSFEILARNDLKERTLASYAAADDALFIRTESHLYRIGNSQ